MPDSPKLNILIAYPYYRDTIEPKLMSLDPDSFRMIIDSGAFTAFHSGKEIQLSEYCKFLKDKEQKYKNLEYVQLDVINNPAKTWENYLKMESVGLDPLPVFTRGEDFSKTDEMYWHKDYIMLGGVAGGENLKGYVKNFMQKNEGRRIHILGFTQMNFIKHFKPTSVDSSTWCGTGRYGNLTLFDENHKKMKLTKRDFITAPTSKTMSVLKSLGLTKTEIRYLGLKDAWNQVRTRKYADTAVGFASYVNTLAAMKMAHETELNIGTHMYFAITNERWLEQLLMANENLKTRGII